MLYVKADAPTASMNAALKIRTLTGACSAVLVKAKGTPTMKATAKSMRSTHAQRERRMYKTKNATTKLVLSTALHGSSCVAMSV